MKNKDVSRNVCMCVPAAVSREVPERWMWTHDIIFKINTCLTFMCTNLRSIFSIFQHVRGNIMGFVYKIFILIGSLKWNTETLCCSYHSIISLNLVSLFTYALPGFQGKWFFHNYYVKWLTVKWSSQWSRSLFFLKY